MQQFLQEGPAPVFIHGDQIFFFRNEGETGELVLSGVTIKFIPVNMILSLSLS